MSETPAAPEGLTVGSLERWLSDWFDLPSWTKADNSLNGLQIGDRARPLRRLAVAVDACLETIRRATDWGADALLVHHGLYWGSVYPLVGYHWPRIQALAASNLALFALHLPLDAHPEVGNNIGLARQLGLENCRPFGRYHGREIGVRGELSRPLRLEEVVVRLFGDDRATLGRLPGGPELNRQVGIISGGAPSEVEQALEAGLDLYITGDASHEIYHRCIEAGINVIFGGHYRTEVWGVSLLARHLESTFGLETRFIDLPTGY